jgi:hypothetical protein
MTRTTSPTHHRWLDVTESVAGHLAAIIVGLVMMIVGLGLSVTMVMLPAGIVIGLVGALVFLGGMFAHFDRRT